jgi:uncharacterized protein YjdB
MKVGESYPLKATFGGRNYTNGLKWESQGTAIVSVSSAGVLTALEAGTASILAYAPDGSNAAVTVTVS